MNPMTDEDSVNSEHYAIKGKRYVRVTRLLQERGLTDFSKIPERDRDYYISRGTHNHLAWEMVEKGTAGGFDFDPEVQKYMPAHALFLERTGFRAIPGGMEKRVHSDELGIAGRLDRLGMIQGRLVLIDYKTSTVLQATSIQTALYLLCLPQYDFSKVERFGVAFRKDGKYKMSEKYPLSDKKDALRHVAEYWESKGGRA